MDKKKKTPLTEPDVAFQILKEQKAPLHYRELITAVLERMGQDATNPGGRLAQIHTEINLDSRFDFLGKGMWGLASWAPKRPVRTESEGPSERGYQPKVADYIWDEDDSDDDIDDEEELLIPDDEDLEADTGEDAEPDDLAIDDLLTVEDDDDLEDEEEEEDPEII